MRVPERKGVVVVVVKLKDREGDRRRDLGPGRGPTPFLRMSIPVTSFPVWTQARGSRRGLDDLLVWGEV